MTVSSLRRTVVNKYCASHISVVVVAAAAAGRPNRNKPDMEFL